MFRILARGYYGDRRTLSTRAPARFCSVLDDKSKNSPSHSVLLLIRDVNATTRGPFLFRVDTIQAAEFLISNHHVALCAGTQ